MARGNSVILMGKIENESLEVKKIWQPDGSVSPVINLFLSCRDEEDKRTYKLPVAVWGESMVKQCLDHIKKGDVLYTQGELRYKFIYNEVTRVREKVFVAVKASTVEFVSKEIKGKKLEHSINEVKLMGNIVDGNSKRGFVMAVDRMSPTGAELTKGSTTDFITVVIPEGGMIKGELKKGSFVIVDGKLMTRPRQENIIIPSIVVSAKEVIGL